ncbi:hypothetical protein LTR24_009496 [Lithohypha guttulata]|uniref:Uncharacterized protein n=1 Tax=Lithohypha guttulata TaxID=1690604 RepID=A0ABR0JWV9_9EURO|nr:hypothetical protein LTR24_009496 [Lithohypha guttulata]
MSGPDPRHLRNWYRLIAPLKRDRALEKEKDYDLACYDATTSFLVIGTDETDWKAYCNTDTYFGDNMPIDKYIDDNLDAPAGDARSATDKPCMDPREYFLLILAHRLRQLSHEWGNVSSALLNRLSAYEEHYLQNIDDWKADLHDDQNLTRIRTYLKAASMLRSFHDTLSTTLRCLDAFKAKDEQNEDLFAHQDNFEDQCGCYQIIIDDQAAHLTRIKEHFFERMQRFESMRESMMAASLLRENRQAKQQSQDIELLTKVTVIYLPFTLAATVCGISEKIPSKNVAVFGFSFAMLIAIPTFMYAFNVWRGRENSLEPELVLETDDETRRKSQPLRLH